MALTFVRDRQFSTHNCSHMFYNEPVASQSFKIRIEPSATPPNIPGGLNVFARNIFDFTHALEPSAGPTVDLRINLSGVNGVVQADFPLTVGVVYVVAVIWDGTNGVQTCYVNGVPKVLGHIFGNTTSRIDPFSMGPQFSNTAVVFTLDDYDAWDSYALTSTDVTTLLNNGDPTTVGPGATWRCRWTLAGATGNAAAIGDAGLKNAYGTGGTDGSDFATVTGAGTATYTAPLVWAPTVTAHPYVAGCGKIIAGTFTSNIDGSAVTPSQLIKTPTITVNGVNLGALTIPWFTGVHQCFFYSTPGSPPFQINPGDVVSLTADSAWANTPSGSVAALSGAIDNRSGKSSVQVESLTKTLRMGMNMTAAGHLEFFPWKNFKFLTGSGFGKLPPGTYQITTSPGERGLWLLVWDATVPLNPVMMSLTTFNPSLVTVTPLPQYNVDPSDGSGKGYVRVYDVEPVAGSAWQTTIDGFTVDLNITDPAYAGDPTPHYDQLWIEGPGEWSIVGGKAVYDRSDPYALSTVFADRMTQNVGSIRWDDDSAGGSVGGTYPYPELLVPGNAENFWGGHPTGPKINYTSIGPLDTTANPYEYHWTYGRPNFQGSTFTATLAQNITTTPAVNTHETYTFSDAATAPLMAGLEIKIDNEVMRIVSVLGTSVTLNRGSNGTTPATHLAGTVTVFGRRPIWIAAGGVQPNAVTCFVTCDKAHGLMDRQGLSQGGNAINMTLASGQVVTAFSLGQIYVTGPTTFIAVSSGPAAGDKPSQVYNSSSGFTGVFGQNFYFYGSGVPVEVQAITTGKFPYANLHINVPVDAVDDMVYAYAQRVLANFPAGRKVYVEYANEPWNWGGAFASFGYVTVMADLTLASNVNTYQLAYYTVRATQVHQIFRNVFAAAGRSSEIVGISNCQMGNGSSQVTPSLNLALQLGAPLDAIACAPYFRMSAYPASVTAFNLYDDDQAAEMLLHDITYNPTTDQIVGQIKDNFTAVQNYNQTNNKSCIMIGYEGGIEFSAPTAGDGTSAGVNFHDERCHDIQYNPNFYNVEQGWYALLQKGGFDHLSIYGLGIGWPASWGMYHMRTQKHSRGDGLNGAANNRHSSVNQTSPYFIGGSGLSSLQTFWLQDFLADSVRGQAFIDWQSSFSAPSYSNRLLLRGQDTMKFQFTRGETNRILRVKIRDVTGAPMTGLTNTSTGLLCYYIIEGVGAAVSVPLVTAAVGTYTSGGFVVVPNLIGTYEFGLPNLAIASGKAVFGQLYGAANMDPCDFELQVDSVNYQDGAAFGLSRLDTNINSRLAATDKAGFSLAASGLDAISAADPGGVAGITTWPKAMMWLFRRFAKKSTLAGGVLKSFADDGNTVNTTQAATDDGTTQTQGPIT